MRGRVTVFAKERRVELAAAGCYVAIAVLSSVPGDLRPHVPGFSDKVEHLVAFLALGVVTSLIAPRLLSWARLSAVVVTYAAVLELGQIFVPGRVASLADLTASAAGALLGVTLVFLVRPVAFATARAGAG
jgi:VanZ family protein